MHGLKVVNALPFGKNVLDGICRPKNNGLERKLWGLTFANPVGLAAGFDKDARFIDELAHLGFGFVEIGTVTPLPQPGNDQPRLFRLPQDEALINRMGFNNEGVRAAAKRLQKRKSNIIVGGNIGKNKLTPNEEAVSDYEKCFHALFDVVDYFVVNVSSPNTPGLRALQEKEPLKQLLHHLQMLNNQQSKPKPILLKIAPDLTTEQLDDIIEIVRETELAGLVATNTTISREGLTTPQSELDRIGMGGLSGRPMRERATEVIRYISQKSGGTIPIIAVGGIFTAADAQEKLDAGASLVQVYTGFIYEGPTIVKKICQGLSTQP
ncbi:quinone-dependent dihydroorotate dehydrogenase [Chitinophaga pollutisoli]|uniref:Dihydroorotate dehydrogenase (quinone) n=1 Tax=Chitinophaga pollutisoli TaxID=3133966 RepID=A0ABZ2YU67_9BACT